jgi:hypothetical protein
MRNRWCLDTLIYDLVEFGRMPPTHCREADGIGWDRIQDGWRTKLKKTVFSGRDDEGEHDKKMHNTYLPETDPLYHYPLYIRYSFCSSAMDS